MRNCFSFPASDSRVRRFESKSSSEPLWKCFGFKIEAFGGVVNDVGGRRIEGLVLVLVACVCNLLVTVTQV